MRSASISIGICEYLNAHYRDSSRRLRYAADDARAFWKYTSSAWNTSDCVHECLTDQVATLICLADVEVT